MGDLDDRQSELHTRQFSFAAHIRDPENNPAPPGIEDRRMEIYRSLFVNNVTSLMANSFPVLADIYGEDRWQLLIRDFYRDHRCHTPLFPEISKEFLDYLENERPTAERTDSQDDPAFLFELAHYEWVEAGLALAQEPEPFAGLNNQGDLLAEHPALSSLAWLVSYRYPVNEIGKANQPTEPAAEPLHYLVYRDADFDVHFLKLNIVSARLFELLNIHPDLSGEQALKKIAAELQHDDPSTVIEAGRQLLEQWRQKGIVAGTQKAA